MVEMALAVRKTKECFNYNKSSSVSADRLKLVLTRSMENKDYAFLLVFVVLVVYEL